MRGNNVSLLPQSGSIAALMLTTEALVCDIPEGRYMLGDNGCACRRRKKLPWAAAVTHPASGTVGDPGHGGMGGMY